jgi:hypothetical protein
MLSFFVAGLRNLLNRPDQRLNGTFRIVRHKNKNSLRLQVVPVSGTWFAELSNNCMRLGLGRGLRAKKPRRSLLWGEALGRSDRRGIAGVSGGSLRG